LPLASLIQDRRVYALNYLPGRDVVRQCLEAILASGHQGTCAFLGYSAGASISLAVARELERMGRPVRRLIFLDAYRPSPALLASAHRQRQLKSWLFAALAEHLGNEESSLDQATREALFDYCLTLPEHGPVAADIHLFTDWSGSTTGSHHVHNGHGSHLEMLGFPFVRDNHRILADIMTRN
jgi:thioesterase domain-containing protein